MCDQQRVFVNSLIKHVSEVYFTMHVRVLELVLFSRNNPELLKTFKVVFGRCTLLLVDVSLQIMFTLTKIISTFKDYYFPSK